MTYVRRHTRRVSDTVLVTLHYMQKVRNDYPNFKGSGCSLIKKWYGDRPFLDESMRRDFGVKSMNDVKIIIQKADGSIIRCRRN